MDTVVAGLPLWAFLLAAAVTLGAGFVKGAIGFAMPLILIAVLPSFMPAPVALAALILPVLATNLHQSLRQGFGADRHLPVRKTPAWSGKLSENNLFLSGYA